jgi:4-hydroxy-tetrahydrodipicolinate synthase
MVAAFRGIFPPLVTPFTADGAVDLPAFRAEVRHMLAQGVHGLVVGGSTGEGEALSDAEMVSLSTAALEEAAAKIPVVGGVIRSSTRDAIRLGKLLAAAGVAALQLTPPRYFYTASLESVLEFYRAVGEGVGLPMVVFNVATRARVTPEYVGKLAKIPGVVAIKQSGGDLHKLADLALANHGRLSLVTAVDDLLYPAFLLGADAAIAPLSPVVPDLCVALWNACRRGDQPTALAVHARILTVWRGVHHLEVIPRLRAAIEERGREVGPPRPPLPSVTGPARAEVVAALREAGLLPPPAP